MHTAKKPSCPGQAGPSILQILQPGFTLKNNVLPFAFLTRSIKAQTKTVLLCFVRIYSDISKNSTSKVIDRKGGVFKAGVGGGVNPSPR